MTEHADENELPRRYASAERLIFESPWERMLAEELVPRLSHNCAIRSQVAIDTAWGRFWVDFVLSAGSRRVGIAGFPMSGTAWASGKPLKVEGNVQPPKVVHTTQPVYPESAKAAKIEGTTVVETVIAETGRVTQPKVKATSGDKDLDKAAVDAVSAWTFEPATLDGKPVAVYYTLTIRFTLD